MPQIIDKLVGETPLEALERFRLGKIQAEKNGNDNNSGASILGTHSWKGVPLTYAGRLDPMAEGKLLILIGEECKDKEKYLGLDKEYEVEIVIGLETDTYDALGIVTNEIGASGIHLKSESKVRWMSIESNDLAISAGIETVNQQWLQRYTGKFVQPYPPYSSKTVNGKQLHELARSGELPTQDEMPTKEVEIYSIDLLSVWKIGADLLLAKILQKIDLVKGDFRQEEIKNQWVQKLTKNWSTLLGLRTEHLTLSFPPLLNLSTFLTLFHRGRGGHAQTLADYVVPPFKPRKTRKPPNITAVFARD